METLNNKNEVRDGQVIRKRGAALGDDAGITALVPEIHIVYNPSEPLVPFKYRILFPSIMNAFLLKAGYVANGNVKYEGSTWIGFAKAEQARVSAENVAKETCRAYLRYVKAQAEQKTYELIVRLDEE
jgi:hypothetical protein